MRQTAGQINHSDHKTDSVNGSRVKVTFIAGKGATVNYQYHHQILGLIYNFLNASDPDFAGWLHNEGYYVPTSKSDALPVIARPQPITPKQSQKTFKLFCFSGIDFHRPIKTTPSGYTAARNNDSLRFSFQIASPINQFLNHLIIGLFEKGQVINLGATEAVIETVETLPEPLINGGEIYLKPLASPIFVKKPMSYGEHDKYLFPGDGDFSFYLNKNLKDKYAALFGVPCLYDDLDFTFYNTDRHSEGGRSPTEESNPPLLKGDIRGFKKLSTTEKVIEIPGKNGKSIKIKGTLKPFKVSGNPNLIKLGLYCGFGANNSMGCGYVELRDNPNTVEK